MDELELLKKKCDHQAKLLKAALSRNRRLNNAAVFMAKTVVTKFPFIAEDTVCAHHIKAVQAAMDEYSIVPAAEKRVFLNPDDFSDVSEKKDKKHPLAAINFTIVFSELPVEGV